MIIEILLALAAIGALVVFLLPDEYAPVGGFVASLFPLVTSFLMWWGFDGSGNALLDGGAAYETNIPWIDLLGLSVHWHVGVDGLSLPLVLLTTAMTTLAILASWTPIEERRSQYYGLLLVLETGLLGVFVSLDFLVWFVFWEVVLVPIYVLVGVWGGPRRTYAAIKFYIYTNIGSLVMFLGFFALVFGLGDSVTSLEMPAIAQALAADELGSLGGVSASTLGPIAFFALFFGFAIKTAIVPFHTWLPDAYAETPTPVLLVFAGVVTKMGTYALLRFNFTILGDVARDYAVWLALFAVVTVIYGALVALSQRDIKRIVAYSTLPSMGFVLLGLVASTVYGLGGATFQMISHGLLTGLLFVCVGIIYRNTGTRMVGDMSGLADRLPVVSGAFLTGAFGYMGLPLLSGFAAEFFVFRGSFDSFSGSTVFTAIAMFGIVLVAGYFLFAMQRVLFGEYRLAGGNSLGRAATDGGSGAGDDVTSGGHRTARTDGGLTRGASTSELLTIALLIAMIVVLGVAPDILFSMIRDAAAPIAGGVP